MFPCRHQQFVKGRPLISPVKIEANALPQLRFIDLPPPPFVKNLLMARENRLHSQHHRAVSRLRPLLKQSRGKTLRRRQRMIIADQHQVGAPHRARQLFGVDHRVVRPKSVTEVPQILAPSARISGPDLAFHASQRMHLRRIAPRP